jgi:hypothetical protein
MDTIAKTRPVMSCPKRALEIMTDKLRASNQNDQPDDPLPPIGERVLVQTEHFRCLAFRDKDGKWKDAYHGNELAGTVRVEKPMW